MALERQATVLAQAREAAAAFITAFDRLKDAQTAYNALGGNASFSSGIFGSTQEITANELLFVMQFVDVQKQLFAGTLANVTAGQGRDVDLYKARG